MTENEQLFWKRVLELAQDELKQAAYDYFVADARLISIENQIATIYLDEVKQMFWRQNLKSVILTAGFEIFNVEIQCRFTFEEPKTQILQQEREEKLVQKTTEITHLAPVISNIDDKYSFDNFVQGEGNKWAKAAAIAVASSPGTIYNPLFIYGGPGLGKTHLLNAIGNEILKDRPNARVRYISAETFINEFLKSLQTGKKEEMKESFRTLDVLLIDDIQSMGTSKMKATQEEFFNTFNVLHSNNKQIVLTSDRIPEQLNGLEKRLVTRFNWGLTVDITPPDYETRVAILTNKIQELPYDFKQNTVEYLANQFSANVRDLEGALKDIDLVARFKHVDTVTVEIAAEAIRARKNDSPKMNVVSIDDIQEQVGKFYGVTIKEIKATKRTQDIVLARQVAMYLAREMTDNSLPKIGKSFGGRDHSTVLHAYNKIKNMLSQDDNLRIELETIKTKIH
ncbi:chromosomal replication initiator protein DnaA [Streptococcus sciuri]|uniref:Chromosomal replication initiator protein DnaA n=1 Tax=Streptococcus sciuri TaxID=2973939 RepID=A0ABT2F6B3_9STRE|nr:chromosomal replication initiator protein DnaA [Streptococcus sciuri]MCS4487974.1 chromosomal replication initiator protein DnaA [Streptococcus sciuri]